MADDPGGALGAAERRAGRLGAAGYAFALCLVALAAAGAIGLLVKQPYLFPSLGPTVMLFFESPTHKSATPRSTLIGHGVALLAGVGCLVVFGLTDHPPVIQEGLTPARIGAAALSVALTALVLRLLSCPHPPAGATTLIVSLGLLTSTSELLAIAAGVVLVTVLAVALNRVLGVRQPIWS
ncbi:HPP family protein [Actinophytocola algeriensis]|uniref:CBS-domain-containing membrane protein n=1 Tax=Actinophytocola algeriensis TaxID=1768010 RepID=A0A7W7VJJ9_9PSEU|nr:HPP family protein [Actinophytocola algeriensis]MBB4912732.1 CBS-domain-containing membrane protein [Actinophytocola algeriensis]MBE1473600.1 CBS-domain-containing membrane protein [Actinophytocola algeriensis]